MIILLLIIINQANAYTTLAVYISDFLEYISFLLLLLLKRNETKHKPYSVYFIHSWIQLFYVFYSFILIFVNHILCD